MPWGRGKTQYFKCHAQVRTVSKKGIVKYKRCGRKFATLGMLERHFNSAHNK